MFKDADAECVIKKPFVELQATDIHGVGMQGPAHFLSDLVTVLDQGRVDIDGVNLTAQAGQIKAEQRRSSACIEHAHAFAQFSLELADDPLDFPV